jgi:hypothetical protein
MYGMSAEMFEKLYVKGSLENQGEGFVFQVKNLIDSGSVSGLAKLAIDDQERPLDGVTFQVGSKARPVTEITWSSPLYVGYGSVLTVYVPGKLEPGEHTVTMQFNVPELGRVSLPITDTIK